MKEYQVDISDQAEQDLRAIFEYIAFELLAPGSASGQLDRLEKEINKLSTFPEGHRRYEEEPWYSRNLRVLPVDNYCVFYILNNDSLTVTVIRVIYCGRDIEKQLNHFTRYKD